MLALFQRPYGSCNRQPKSTQTSTRMQVVNAPAQAAVSTGNNMRFERSLWHLFSTMNSRRKKPEANEPPTGPSQHEAR
jgi:hypothetical protein